MPQPDDRKKQSRRPPYAGKLFLLAGVIVLVIVIILICTVFFGRHTDSLPVDNKAVSSAASSPDESMPEKKTRRKASKNKKDPFADLSYREKLSYLKKHKNSYPKRYRKMAKDYPETIDFVLQYPKLHKKKYRINLAREADGKKVPLLIQWDRRWGYRPYGDGAIGYTGCGPTCISMVALYLTGNKKYTPVYVAKNAQKNDYYVNGEGTKWEFMSDGCESFQIKASQIPVSKEAIRTSVKNHHPVICSVSEGDFTKSGHFIVIASYKDGYFTIKDPNSRVNSKKKWSYEKLRSQIRCCWSYRKSEIDD